MRHVFLLIVLLLVVGGVGCVGEGIPGGGGQSGDIFAFSMAAPHKVAVVTATDDMVWGER